MRKIAAETAHAELGEGGSAPTCRHLGECGGCVALAVPYREQLEAKETRLRACIASLQPDLGEAVSMRACARPQHYRNKVIYPLQRRRGRRGRRARGLAAGFYRRGTHDLVQIEECALQEPCLTRILARLRGVLEEMDIEPRDECSGSGFARSIFARVASGSGEMMVGLCTRSGLFPEGAAFRRRAEEEAQGLRTARGREVVLTSVMRSIHDEPGNRLLGRRNVPLGGREYIIERMGRLRLRISCGSFFQVNVPAAIELYDIVAEMVGPEPPRRSVECYSGIGALSLWLRDRLAGIWNIESSRSAVRDARANFAAHGLDPARVIEGRVEDRLPGIEGRLDLLIIDPPRAGLAPGALAATLECAPERLIYLSCNPASFERDARVLLAAGYELQRAQGVDLFPHTSHFELVAQFRLVRS